MFTSHRFAKFACTALVGAGFGLAAGATGATASAAAVDDTFIADITSAGIQYDSAASMIAQAHSVCSALNDGTDQMSIFYDIVLQNSMTDRQAKKLIIAAAVAYCPDRLPYA
jgi:hypothetical protein